MSRSDCRLALPSLLSVCVILIAFSAAGCGDNPTPTATATPTQTPTPSPTATVIPAPDAVIFSPAVTYVNNPVTADVASGSDPVSSQFTINMNAFDINGNPITPSASNPIQVDVYGAPSGVIVPTSNPITSGSAATFTYNGAFFPNNISINAWIADPVTGGAAIGVTQVLMQTTPPCTLGKINYSVPLTSTVPNELQIEGAVGYTNPTSVKGHLQTYTIDTGSLGTIVNTSDLPESDGGANTLVIGPAGRA